jgi:hypothetical protein
MGVQTHPTLSLTVIALEASHADSHKSRDHSLQGYLFHATRQGSGSTSSFRLWSRPPLTQQKISIRRYTRVCPIMAQDRRYLLCSFRRMSGSLIIQGYRGEMSKVVGTGEMMVWLVCKQSSRPDSFPGLKFHFQTFRSTIPRNEFQPLPSEAKSMSRSEPFSTLTNLEPAYIGPRHHTKRTIHLLSPTSVCYYPNIQFQICCSDATIQSPHLPASTGRNVSNFPIRSPPRTVFPTPRTITKHPPSTRRLHYQSSPPNTTKQSHLDSNNHVALKRPTK